MEVDSRRRVSIPSSAGSFLCRGRNRKSIDCFDVFPLMPGTHGTHLDNSARIDPCWCCCTLLSHILRGRILVGTPLQANERKELGSMHSIDRHPVPSSRGFRFLVGQLDCCRPWIYKCPSIHNHLDNYSTLHFPGLPPHCFWWNCGEELCQPRFQRTNPHHQSCPRDSNRNSMVPKPAVPSFDCRIPALLGNLH